MIKRLLIGLSLFGFFAAPTWAAFEDTGTGARASALAGGYVAAADDTLSLLYNPAGLANVNRKEVASEYAKLFAGLTDGSNISQTFLAYSQPLRWGGTASVGWKQFSLDNLYSERTLSLGYGEWITSRVAGGFALKQLHHEFSSPNIVVDDAGNIQAGQPSFFAKYGNSQTAYSADLGFLIKPADRYTVGVAIQDFNEPNVAVNPADHEVVNKTVRLGVAYDAPKDLKVMAGVVSHKSLSDGPDTTWTGAGEKWWGKQAEGAFALRGSLSAGSRDFKQFGLGASYRLTQLQVDYAFLFNIGGLGIGDTEGTHRFSLSYRFGPDRSELGQAPKTKKTPKQVSRDAEIEELLGEGLPTYVPKPKAKTSEPQGPGLTNVQVQTTPAVQPPAVQPSDYAVPLTQGAATAQAQEVEPLSRLQVIVSTLKFSTEYLLRTAHNMSADDRLAALDAIFPTLIGYVRGSGEEMTDLMTQTDQLEAARKDYGRMTWEGASANDRLASLVRTLESWLGPILKARTWDMHDGRDIRYKAWLDSALAEHDQLIKTNVAPQLRIDSIRMIVSRALAFEREPREPLTTQAPAAPAVSTTTAVTPAIAPMPTLVPTPTPVVPIATPTVVVPTPVAPAVPASTPTVHVTPVKAAKPVVTKKPVKRGQGGVPAFYKVKEGDTLINLAERFYGDYKRWREIYILNQDRLDRGGNLKVGQLLIMPQKDKQK